MAKRYRVSDLGPRPTPRPKEVPWEAVVQRIDHVQAQRGLRKGEVARRAGISAATYSDLRRVPADKESTINRNPETLAKVARALGVSVHYLLTGEGDWDRLGLSEGADCDVMTLPLRLPPTDLFWILMMNPLAQAGHEQAQQIVGRVLAPHLGELLPDPKRTLEELEAASQGGFQKKMYSAFRGVLADGKLDPGIRTELGLIFAGVDWQGDDASLKEGHRRRHPDQDARRKKATKSEKK